MKVPALTSVVTLKIELRFSNTLQTMLSLAIAEHEGVAMLSAAQLAEGLGANLSFVLELLVPLAQDQLVVSSMGKHGGVRLGRCGSQWGTNHASG